MLEFAAKHADECQCPARNEHIAAQVDALIETSVVIGKVLWQVGVDADGRASLIWQSYPDEAWRALLAEAERVHAIKALLGMDR